MKLAYQHAGLKSKQEAIEHIFACLYKDAKKITNRSLSGEAVFHFGGRVITIKGKKKNEKGGA